MCHVLCIDFNESKRMTKPFTSSTKEAYLAQFHQSGLTQAAFCRQHGLVFKTFNNWLRQMRVPTVKLSPFTSPPGDLDPMNPFQNGVATIRQAAFMPVHLKDDDDVCDSSLHQPLGTDISVAPQAKTSSNVVPSILASAPLQNVSPPNASHQSVLGFKTNGFRLDIALDLATDYGQAAAKNLIHMLHQLPDQLTSEHDSHD